MLRVFTSDRPAIAACLAVALLAAGCGSDKEGDGAAHSRSPDVTQPTPTVAASPVDDETAVEETLRTYLTSIGAGDGETACAQLTDDAQREAVIGAASVAPELKGKPCAEAIVAFADLYGKSLDAPKIKNVKVSGDRATATGPLGEKAALVRDGDRWKIEQYGD